MNVTTGAVVTGPTGITGPLDYAFDSYRIVLDFSATPKDQKGQIFRHVVVDYPLAEAVSHGIVKTPVIGEVTGATVELGDSVVQRDRQRPRVDRAVRAGVHIGHVPPPDLGLVRLSAPTRLRKRPGIGIACALAVDPEAGRARHPGDARWR